MNHGMLCESGGEVRACHVSDKLRVLSCAPSSSAWEGDADRLTFCVFRCEWSGAVAVIQTRCKINLSTCFVRNSTVLLRIFYGSESEKIRRTSVEGAKEIRR